eukprot:8219930-Ditylum_brightwellii.AAC.1
MNGGAPWRMIKDLERGGEIVCGTTIKEKGDDPRRNMPKNDKKTLLENNSVPMKKEDMNIMNNKEEKAEHI